MREQILSYARFTYFPWLWMVSETVCFAVLTVLTLIQKPASIMTYQEVNCWNYKSYMNLYLCHMLNLYG